MKYKNIRQHAKKALGTADVTISRETDKFSNITISMSYDGITLKERVTSVTENKVRKKMLKTISQMARKSHTSQVAA